MAAQADLLPAVAGKCATVRRLQHSFNVSAQCRNQRRRPVPLQPIAAINRARAAASAIRPDSSTSRMAVP